MKGEINFELKAGNIIIHAPADTPKHPNIFTYGRKKGQATQGNLTWRTGMAGLFARV